MKKLTPYFTLLTILAFPIKAKAVCPLCTIAVGTGLGFSRVLGIDDSITGVWIGGLIISSGIWLSEWVKNKQWKIPNNKLFHILIMSLFVIPPLYISDMIGIAGNTIFGLDKILFGTLIGVIVFSIAFYLDKYLRQTNNGKVYIHYQKVLLPMLLLTVSSLVLYLYVTK